jgi:hypothetical protein
VSSRGRPSFQSFDYNGTVCCKRLKVNKAYVQVNFDELAQLPEQTSPKIVINNIGPRLEPVLKRYTYVPAYFGIEDRIIFA